MNVSPIRSEADYDAALAAIDGLMGAAPDTPEGDALGVLVVLVEACEAERWPMGAPGFPRSSTSWRPLTLLSPQRETTCTPPPCQGGGREGGPQEHARPLTGSIEMDSRFRGNDGGRG